MPLRLVARITLRLRLFNSIARLGAGHPAATMWHFLSVGGCDEQRVESMHQAWFKAVTPQTALWAKLHAGRSW